MKTTKFLPLALSAMLLAPAAFAGTDGTASTTMTITVPEFINITVNEDAFSSDATISGDYTGMTITAMAPSFHVTTNYNGKNVILSAKATGSDGEAEALNGTAAAKPVIAFANTDTPPTKAQIGNALTGGDVDTNPNVIAFQFTATPTPDTDTPAEITTTSGSTNKITYTLKNGKYDFLYTSGTAPTATSFSTHDEKGTYVSTLTMTHVALGG